MAVALQALASLHGRCLDQSVMKLSGTPVPLPSRICARGELKLLNPFRIGNHMRRTSTIPDAVHKKERASDMWFVMLGHQHEATRSLSICERRDVVYCEAADRSTGKGIPTPAASKDDPGSASRKIETPRTLRLNFAAMSAPSDPPRKFSHRGLSPASAGRSLLVRRGDDDWREPVPPPLADKGGEAVILVKAKRTRLSIPGDCRRSRRHCAVYRRIDD
ncbi:hypothetical protein [Nitratireductor alexandrii]|uniref:hypothetical protein n=1 Tax=Nitratireductor alexandrii TaxID=2448161 RepID=UPI000FDAC1C2|nr:hypothetical protein [Nitratireductor alexandrii]